MISSVREMAVVDEEIVALKDGLVVTVSLKRSKKNEKKQFSHYDNCVLFFNKPEKILRALDHLASRHLAAFVLMDWEKVLRSVKYK